MNGTTAMNSGGPIRIRHCEVERGKKMREPEHFIFADEGHMYSWEYRVDARKSNAREYHDAT